MLREHTFVFQSSYRALVTTVRELTPVRAEPRADSEQVTQILAGEPLDVDEVSGRWARIRTAYEYPGWIEAAAPGGAPDRRRALVHLEPAPRARGAVASFRGRGR
jgi:hypothetical protein